MALYCDCFPFSGRLCPRDLILLCRESQKNKSNDTSRPKSAAASSLLALATVPTAGCFAPGCRGCSNVLVEKITLTGEQTKNTMTTIASSEIVLVGGPIRDTPAQGLHDKYTRTTTDGAVKIHVSVQ